MKIPTQLSRANAAQRTVALLAVATVCVVPATAANHATRLHAASHPAGHVIATHTQASHSRGRHAAAVERTEAHPGRRANKTALGKAAIPATKSRAKSTRSRRHEPEIVNEPVVMHRASAHRHQLSTSERRLEIAEARYEASHRPAAKHAAPAEQAAAYAPQSSVSQYSSHEFAASYENASRAMEQAVRPNAYTRRLPPTNVGTALRSAPAQDQNGDAQYVDAASDPIADQARRSSVVVRRPTQPAQIAAAETPIPSPQRYAPRVATGFGAEVVPLSSTAQRAGLSNTAQVTAAQDLGEDLAANGVPSARTLADDAMQPLVTPMYTRDGNLMMPAPLRGSHEILVHQNMMADHDGLERIRDDYQLNRLRAQHELVAFPAVASLRVNEGLPENRRYARPWTVQFAADAAKAFYAHFGEPLQVNSAVRTVSYQLRLQRVNGNAAATRGDGASPHLTGQAIDLAKRGMTTSEIAWMRTYLLPFIEAGTVDVEEEFQQACFHISVYRAYLPTRQRPTQVAQLRPAFAGSSTKQPIADDTER